MKKLILNQLKTVSFASMVTVLSACGGGGGSSSSGVLVSDMTVVEAEPASLSTDVDRDPLIRVKFSDDIFQPSVNNDSFQLINSNTGEPVLGQFSFVGTDEFHFSVDEDLDLLTVYRPRITTELTDIDGWHIANQYDWSFVTRDGVWQTPESVAIGAVDIPKVIAVGNSFIAFYLRDNLFSGQVDLFARRLMDDGTWGASRLISEGVGDGDVQGNFQVVELVGGDLLVVWQLEAEDGTDEIWYARQNSASGEWNTSERVLDNGSNLWRPTLASNGNDVLMLFQLEDTVADTIDIKVIDYSVADDLWGVDEMIANDLDFPAGDGGASIAIDDEGNAVITWLEGFRINARSYAASSEIWGSITQIDELTSTFDDGSSTNLVVDSQNQFVAAWSHKLTGAGTPRIWTNRFIPGQGWGDAQAIASSSQGVNPKMASSTGGDIVMVWGLGDSLYWSRFDALGDAWAAGQPLEAQNQPVLSVPELTVDRSGNVTAIWAQNLLLPSVESIQVRRFDNLNDNGWLELDILGSSSDGTVHHPVLATNQSGEIMALWREAVDGESPVITSRHFK